MNNKLASSPTVGDWHEINISRCVYNSAVPKRAVISEVSDKPQIQISTFMNLMPVGPPKWGQH